MAPEFTDRMRHSCLIVDVRGEIDLGSARIFGQRLSLALTRQAAATILDLSGLVFLDCAGLRVLLAASRPDLHPARKGGPACPVSDIP